MKTPHIVLLSKNAKQRFGSLVPVEIA